MQVDEWVDPSSAGLTLCRSCCATVAASITDGQSPTKREQNLPRQVSSRWDLIPVRNGANFKANADEPFVFPHTHTLFVDPVLQFCTRP